MNDEVEVEEKRKPGRPRKHPRVGILSAAQIMEIKGITPEEDQAERERKDRDAARKRLDRKLARAEKEVENIESYEQLWQHNRTMLSESELTALLERQERVWDELYWAEAWMNGTYDVSPADLECYVSLQEGSEDLFAHVKEYGVTTMEVTLLGAYWQQPIWEKFRNGSDPTSIFAKLGLVTAFPDHKLHQFKQFLATQNAT